MEKDIASPILDLQRDICGQAQKEVQLIRISGVNPAHEVFYIGDLFLEGQNQPGRQHGGAVFFALYFSNNDLRLLKVNIFHPQAGAFHQSQPASVEQLCHQLMQSLHSSQYPCYFILR